MSNRKTQFVLGIILFLTGFMFFTWPVQVEAADKLVSADTTNGYKMIPTSYPVYTVKGLIEETFDVRAVKVYISGGYLPYVYNVVDVTKDADNGYLVVEANQADGWIAFFGKTSINAPFVKENKSLLTEVRISENGLSDELFYNFAEIAQYAGGQPGQAPFDNCCV